MPVPEVEDLDRVGDRRRVVLLQGLELVEGEGRRGHWGRAPDRGRPVERASRPAQPNPPRPAGQSPPTRQHGRCGLESRETRWPEAGPGVNIFGTRPGPTGATGARRFREGRPWHWVRVLPVVDPREGVRPRARGRIAAEDRRPSPRRGGFASAGRCHPDRREDREDANLVAETQAEEAFAENGIAFYRRVGLADLGSCFAAGIGQAGSPRVGMPGGAADWVRLCRGLIGTADWVRLSRSRWPAGPICRRPPNRACAWVGRGMLPKSLGGPLFKVSRGRLGDYDVPGGPCMPAPSRGRGRTHDDGEDEPMAAGDRLLRPRLGRAGLGPVPQGRPSPVGLRRAGPAGRGQALRRLPRRREAQGGREPGRVRHRRRRLEGPQDLGEGPGGRQGRVDAAGGEAGRPSEARGDPASPSRSKAWSPRRAARPPRTPGGSRSAGSTARNTTTRSATSSGSTSARPTTSPPTTWATASTTSATSSPCRRS